MKKLVALSIFAMVMLTACGDDSGPSRQFDDKGEGVFITNVSADDGVNYRCITIWDNGIWCERLAVD